MSNEARVQEIARHLPDWQQRQLQTLLTRWAKWRNADHEDAIVVCRSDICAILDAFKPARAIAPLIDAARADGERDMRELLERLRDYLICNMPVGASLAPRYVREINAAISALPAEDQAWKNGLSDTMTAGGTSTQLAADGATDAVLIAGDGLRQPSASSNSSPGVAPDPSEATQGAEPTERQVASACLSFRHDYGLLPKEERELQRFVAKEWLHAWQKEGFAYTAPPAPDREAVARKIDEIKAAYQKTAKEYRDRGFMDSADRAEFCIAAVQQVRDAVLALIGGRR